MLRRITKLMGEDKLGVLTSKDKVGLWLLVILGGALAITWGATDNMIYLVLGFASWLMLFMIWVRIIYDRIGKGKEE